MNKFELLPEYNNLKACILSNSIGRNEELCYFVRMINELGGNCSIALNARWGEGKTFFVNQAKLILDAHNDYCNEFIVHGLQNEDDADEIKEWFKLNTNNYTIDQIVSVYYDAWENDDDEDPILSIIASILDTRLVNNEDERVKNIYDKAISILGDLFQAKSNIKVATIENANRKPIEIACDNIKDRRNFKKIINDFINGILIKDEKKIVVFIDELDRCKPVYAIKLLERIKHYFNNEKIMFVFSVNLEQLRYTIKKQYGNDFDADQYLSRFFDYSIELLPCDKDKFYNLLELKEGSYIYDYMIKDIAEYFDFSLREIIRFHSACHISYRSFVNSSNYGSPSYNDFKNIVSFVIPILIGFRTKNFYDYLKIVDGNGQDMFRMICTNVPFVRGNIKDAFGLETDTQDEFYSTINLLYSCLFGDALIDNYRIEIGKVDFSERDKKNILKMVSLVSSFSNFK